MGMCCKVPMKNGGEVVVRWEGVTRESYRPTPSRPHGIAKQAEANHINLVLDS